MTDPIATTRHELLMGWEVPKSQPGMMPSSARSPMFHSGEGHLITIAPTGAGKGVGCVIPALLTWPGPAIVVDPKGENYAVTARRRYELGQEVVLFDPFDATGTGKSACLNPFDLIDPGSSSVADDARLIANLCLQERRFIADPYWDDCAETLIVGLILFVLKHAPEAKRHLGYVRQIVENNLSESAWPTSQMQGADDLEINTAANILTLKSDRTRACIISSASSHLSFMSNGPVRDCLQSSTFRLDDVKSGLPLTVYLVLPPDKLATHGKLLRLWLGVFMTVIARRRTIPEQSTLFLIDEAAQLGQLASLRSALTLMRGYGLKVWSFWQDLSQIARLYPTDWQTLLNNCGVQQFFRPASPFAAKQLNDYLAGSVPTSLRFLDAQDCVLVRSGHHPTIVRRPDYRTDAFFRGLANPNPFHSTKCSTSAPDASDARERETNVIAFRRCDAQAFPSYRHRE